MPRELVVNGSIVEKLVWLAQHRTWEYMQQFIPMNPMTQEQWSEFWFKLNTK